MDKLKQAKLVSEPVTGIQFRHTEGTWELRVNTTGWKVLKGRGIWTDEISFSVSTNKRPVVTIKTLKGEEYESDVLWLHERLNKEDENV